MTFDEIMKALEKMGTAQNRKVYARHGVSDPCFGVSYANLGKLKRKIKTDQSLAEELWASGNHDARVLATMIADPEAIKAKTLDAWVKDLSDHVLTHAFSTLASQHETAAVRMEKWIGSKSEWVAAAGWGMLHGQLGSMDKDALRALLKNIEDGIHDAPNRVRYNMNSALINIGAQKGMQRDAIAAARRIGNVEVDHGETGCKTPDAEAYIKKMAERAKAKKAGS